MSNKLKAAAAVVCLGLLFLGIRSALESHDEKIRVETKLQAHAEYRKTLDAQKVENDRKAEADKKPYREQIAQLEKERDKWKRAKQAVKIINQNVPLSAPIENEDAALRGTDERHGAEVLPDAPSVRLNPEQVEQIAKFTAWCKECDVDRANYIANESLLQKKIASLEKDKQDALNAVRGGTRWSRFGKAVKHVGIGVAIGVAVGAAVKR